MKKPTEKKQKPIEKTEKPAPETKKPVIKADEPEVEADELEIETDELEVEAEKPGSKFRIPRRLRAWIRESQFLATTLSIILTFGTTGLVEHCQRIKDRKMSALMVMSNIDQFSQQLDKRAQEMARLDSISTWMLSLPKDSLDMIPVSDMTGIINQIVALELISHDKTAEGIFSSGIETWKNLGYFQFIDNVGLSFSKMNNEESYWNEWVELFEKTVYNVIEHPDEHPGKHTWTKLLNNEAFRTKIESFHVRKEYLEYSAEYLRHLNSKSMALIGINEDEVKAFTQKRALEADNSKPAPLQSDFRKPQLNRDSLTTLRPLIQHIDSVIHNNKGKQ